MEQNSLWLILHYTDFHPIICSLDKNVPPLQPTNKEQTMVCGGEVAILKKYINKLNK